MKMFKKGVFFLLSFLLNSLHLIMTFYMSDGEKKKKRMKKKRGKEEEEGENLDIWLVKGACLSFAAMMMMMMMMMLGL